MAEPHTPTTEAVRFGYTVARAGGQVEQTVSASEFNRWLAEHDRQVRAAERAPLVRILRDLADPNPCTFDHHGGCQEHGYLELAPGQACPVHEAQQIIAAETEAAHLTAADQGTSAEQLARQGVTTPDPDGLAGALRNLADLAAQCAGDLLDAASDAQTRLARAGASAPPVNAEQVLLAEAERAATWAEQTGDGDLRLVAVYLRQRAGVVSK